METNKSSVINSHKLFKQNMSVGQKIADKVASLVGSWTFIIIQSSLLSLWIIINIIGFIYSWDPYPFVFLNLILGIQSVYSAPLIMMSQNRKAELDSLEAHHHYLLNIKSEQETRMILEKLENIENLIKK